MGKGASSRSGQGAPEAAGDFPLGIPPEMLTGAGLVTLADLLPVMVGYFDRDLIFRFANTLIADWLGRPRSELIGLPMREVVGERAFHDRRDMAEAALAGELQFFILEYDHPARGPLAVQSQYIPWRAPDGEVLGFVVVVQDVTEQRTAERALRESEARFRRIANSAPVMMWVTRRDGSRDFVNDTYVRFSGLSAEEARKADWTAMLHPEDRDRVLAGWDLFAAGKPISFEARFRRYDGEYRWLRSVSQPRFGPGGELVGYIGTATDITVAKEAELELRRLVDERTAELAESESRFRAIFDTVLEVLVLLKPDGTIVEMNRKDTPWRASNFIEAMDCKVWDAPTLQLYPQYQERLKQAVREVAGGAVFNDQVALERTGMPTTWLDVSMQPVRDAAGAILYILFEARDISDLRSAQEQLRQAQKMEALGQLTGGIAHDFNNLLTVVVGGLDLVARRVEDAKLKRYVVNALTAAERGARLTGQLLAFSRVQRLEVRPVDVLELIESMRPLLRNLLGPGITKTFDLDPATVPVMADPTQLEVAVLNLAINARDAMSEGGVLHFATRPVTVRGDPELEAGDYVELTISDTGCGMPQEVANRAFEPFFTTKDVGKGTGLGLSMVYGMARQSGGMARIETAPGEGTTVRLYLKKANVAVEAEAAEAQNGDKARQGSAASVLVVDDDPDVRGFIAEALAENDYRVRDCGDGRMALELFASERPDLVILDYVMPSISGAEVAQRILSDYPEQKILFVSGYSETEAIRTVAPEAGLLAKPFRADALANAVQKVLAKT